MGRQFLFIDEQVNVKIGPEAEAALASVNDQSFFVEGRGVTQVPLPRWEDAQAAEQTSWMVQGVTACNDRNDDHLRGFCGYQALKRKQFPEAIELGCGPFTNLRLIGGVCSIKECTLLDPLLETYLTHPNCTYDRRRLRISARVETSVTPRFLHRLRRWFPFLDRTGTRRDYVKIRELIAAPIERMPAERRYDLVVLINVIEHCYDLEQVFTNVLNISDTGSTLVFQDKYYDASGVKSLLTRVYDAAHPLRVDRRIIDAFLADHFDCLYRSVEPFTNPLLEEDDNQDFIYFIGRRK